MTHRLPLFLSLSAALVLLTACESQIDFRGPGPTQVKTTRSVFDAPAPVVAPPPGRSSAQRSARRDYYGGPRGQEF